MPFLRRLRPLLLTALVLILGLAGTSLSSAQQDESTKQLYSVSGVKVDVRDKDAAQAKLKAISDAQLKAFSILAKRLVSPKAARQLSKLGRREVGRLMASLSVETESSAPGRYIGKFTIRFLPDKVRKIFKIRALVIRKNNHQKL